MKKASPLRVSCLSYWFFGVLVLVVFLFFPALLDGQKPVEQNVSMTHARCLGKTRALRDLPKQASIDARKRAQSKKRREREVRNFAGRDFIDAPAVQGLPKGKDPLFEPNQWKNNAGLLLEPIFNFEGMGESVAGNIFPSDVNGEVGALYVVETINASWMQVFDKETGQAVSDPISTNTIWNELGISSFGDPIIAYDREAGRWLLVELGGLFDNIMLFAISEGEDPLGSWTAYELSALFFPDYPKLSIWSDSYVITTNEPEAEGAALYVLRRDDFLNTNPEPAVQRFVLPAIVMNWGIPIATPADWDGNIPPPADALPMVVRMVDDAWGNYPQDLIEVWSIEVDWDNPDNSQLVGPVLVEPQPFDSNPCQAEGLYTCVPGTGDYIEGIAGIIMYRVQYRNFGDYQTLLFNFIADVSGNDDSGIRWMELRKYPGLEWEVHQEGIIGTEDGEHRVMASMAMDGNGNIAAGYSVSGEETHVATRITGRRSSDQPGQMTVMEYESATGLSQYFFNRWGDYSAMVLDPQDDRTFWYFGQFARENSLYGTQITAFSLQRDTNDIGPYALLSPQDASLLGAEETVTVQVRNFGLDTQMVFQVGYQFENQPPVVADVNFVLAPDSFYTHTFAQTVDMSAIGDYEFALFTVMDGDQASFNDTLRKVVQHLPRFDAGIVEVVGIDAAVCATEVAIEAVIKNYGIEDLTQVNVYWSLNGSAPQLAAWTGNLPFGETTALPLNIGPLQEGINTLELYTDLPNGMADEVPENDSLIRDFNAFISSGEILLTILTDNYPQETTWELYDEGGDLLYAGGPYDLSQTVYEHSLCLPSNSCFTFIIYDSFGDGISFGGVSGSYQITDASGEVLASIINVSFGFQEQNDFCTEFGCFVEVDISLTNESAAGMQDGAIFIEPTSGAGPFSYSIDGGETFQSDGLFENLPGGTYEVVVIDANGCSYSETVEVHQCQVNILLDVTDESAPGAMDGSIEIQVSGLSIPIQYSIDGGQSFYPYSVFENLAAGTYEIIAMGASGCQGSVENVVLGVSTAVSSTVYGYDVQLFPNPTEGFFEIHIRGLEGVSWLRLEVLDIRGRVVGHGSLARYNDVLRGPVSLNTLPAGSYYLRFDHDFLPLQRVIKK